MKKIAVFLVLVFCLALTACNRPVKELDDYIKIQEEIILEMDKKIEANPTQAGVDEARKVYESKKDDFKAKCVAVRGKDLSSDETKRMMDSAVNRSKMLDLISSKIKNIDASQNFTKLINDFNATCK